MISINWAWWLS